MKMLNISIKFKNMTIKILFSLKFSIQVTNKSYYDKYLKYKQKYLILKKNFED